jgi:hypothetical protein
MVIDLSFIVWLYGWTQCTNMSSILHQHGCKIFHGLFFSWSLMTLIFNTFIWHVGSVYCISDILNPTPVYVVQGDDAVLQCGFESSSL